MGAGKSMLYSCLLDHRSWFAPSTCHSKPMCVLWETSKSLTDAKLYVGKAEIYQVKNPLSASGQAPVASESVVALSARGPLRGVGREQALCSWAGSALRADWNLGQRSAASNLCIATRTKLVRP